MLSTIVASVFCNADSLFEICRSKCAARPLLKLLSLVSRGVLASLFLALPSMEHGERNEFLLASPVAIISLMLARLDRSIVEEPDVAPDEQLGRAPT